MKKKTVVLCELHEDDRIAVNVLHIGVCAACNEAIAQIAQQAGNSLPHGNGSVNGNGRKRRANLTVEEKQKMRMLRKTVPLKTVAEMFGVSPSTVTRYANSTK